jgi:collagen type III alpha
VVGETHYAKAIRALFGGDFDPKGTEITVPVQLIPDRNNRHDRNAVGVWSGSSLLGHLPRSEAARYVQVLASLSSRGLIPEVSARVSGREWGAYDGRPATFDGSIRLDLAEPHMLVPANSPPAREHRVLPAGSAVQVNGQQAFLEALRPLLRPEGECWAYVTLHETAGHLVEVRVGDARVGDLSPKRSGELLPVLRHMAEQGLVTAARATVKGTDGEAEVMLSIARVQDLPESWQGVPAPVSPAAPPVFPSGPASAQAGLAATGRVPANVPTSGVASTGSGAPGSAPGPAGSPAPVPPGTPGWVAPGEPVPSWAAPASAAAAEPSPSWVAPASAAEPSPSWAAPASAAEPSPSWAAGAGGPEAEPMPSWASAPPEAPPMPSWAVPSGGVPSWASSPSSSLPTLPSAGSLPGGSIPRLDPPGSIPEPIGAGASLGSLLSTPGAAARAPEPARPMSPGRATLAPEPGRAALAPEPVRPVSPAGRATLEPVRPVSPAGRATLDSVRPVSPAGRATLEPVRPVSPAPGRPLTLLDGPGSSIAETTVIPALTTVVKNNAARRSGAAPVSEAPEVNPHRPIPPPPNGIRFVVPPGWPVPPDGWFPPDGWRPDPSWPPAPGGWQWWVPTWE